MNLILFEASEIAAPLPSADPRAVHLVAVLRRKPGESFDAGIVNGSRGKGIIESIESGDVAFRFEPLAEPAPPDPIDLLVALPRPQTARKILGEATSLGVASLRFFRPEKGEPSYASSTLWTTPEWRRHPAWTAPHRRSTRGSRRSRHDAAVSRRPSRRCRRAARGWRSTTTRPRSA